MKSVLDRGHDDVQVLVISMFDGIGACRVALDAIGAKVGGYIAVEEDEAAKRVVEASFGSTEFVQRVQEIDDDMVRRWACAYSRVGLVLLTGGPPCQGVSGLNASRLGAELDHRSKLHLEIPRVRELLGKYFHWASARVLMESVSSMAEHDRVCMTRSIGILPYELDAQGLAPCRRSRMFWFSWAALAEEGVSITKPETSSSWDCEG